MPRLVLVALLLTVPASAFPSPVPDAVTHAKQFKKVFGASHAPDAGCVFRFDGKTLTAKFSKERVGSQYDHLGCPRTERRVTGDFEASVTVRTTAPVEPPKNAGGKRCDIGGGLAVWEPDAGNPKRAATDEQKRAKAVSVCRYYDFQSEPRRGEPRTWLRERYAHYPDTVYHRDEDGGDPTEVTHVRLTRKGGTLTTEVSPDGEKWTRVGSRAVDLPDAVSVGVWAFNGTGRECDVTFEQFALTPLK